jgi:hypothetical protein
MNRPLAQHRFMTGQHLWLVMAAVIGLGLSTQAAAAKECARETPLPADVRLTAPSPEVPEAVARFAGAWVGAWQPSGIPGAIYQLGRLLVGRGRFALCHTLIVEEVFANGFARLISSYGAEPAVDLYWPRFLRLTGRIIDGALRVQYPDGSETAYRLAGETLQGIYHGDGRSADGRMRRVADLGQVGCGQPADAPAPAPPATERRERLTTAELLSPTETGTGPVHNAFFMPVGPAAPALHVFQGTVSVGASTIFRAQHGCLALPETRPGFSVAFFTHGEHLVPVVRDILRLPGIILSPGRVWSEPGDGGLSRASFPFVVTDGGASHNGLATFLYDNMWVSGLRWQVIQENVPWRVTKLDSWGQAPMTYRPGQIAHEAAWRAWFAAELRHQTPIRPWSALPVSSGAPWLEGFDGDTAPDDLKASGMIVDGVIYLRGCETRWGPYPYCRQMRHGVFSVTKSLGAAVTLLRLAQIYGDQVFDLKIKDYVTVTAAHDGWERVTFADALNMATGIGDNWPQREPNHPLADELSSPKFFRWARARTAKAKLDATFSFGKYPWGPGEVLRYNSVHTFILATAMDSFLKRQAGPQAQLWDMVVADVLQPLGIFSVPILHALEADGGRGIPLLESGLYPTIDDVAKLTTLLQQGGRHQGRQLLRPTKLAEALYKTPALGLPSGMDNRFGTGRYQLSCWSVPYRTRSGCIFHIPYLSGWGGNIVMLLPNGILAFRLADGDHYDVDTMVLAGEAIRPFPCPAGSGEAPPPTRQPLSASEVRAAFPGHTFYGGSLNILPLLVGKRPIFFPAVDGMLYGTLKGGPDRGMWDDVGKWQITPDGQLCWTWQVRYSGRERCYRVYQEGETFELFVTDRLDKEVYRRVPGNPEGY